MLLGKQKIIAFVPTKDARRARAFFEKKLGLRLVSEDQFAVIFDANGTMLRVTPVGDFMPFPFTILGWEVEDIELAAKELIAKGVQFSRFDGLQQNETGIWNAPGGARVGWFKDPDGNVLSISQHP
jgi:catechol 2,3-dioxygenase-like lactoylglutathione lyase family enzyme